MEAQNTNIGFVVRINTGLIAFISILLTVGTILWNAFYGYGQLSGKIDSMQDDIKEIKEILAKMNDRFDRLEGDLHKVDLRVNTLEQHRP